MYQEYNPWLFVIACYAIVYLSLAGVRLVTEAQIRKTRKEMEALHES